MRHRLSHGSGHGRLALFLAVVVAAGCSTGIAAPDETPTSDQIVGVAWFDADGDGRADDGEQPADGLELALGVEARRVGQAAMTDDRGGFVVGIPDLGLGPSTAYFVDAAIPVSGPADQSSLIMRYRQDIGTDRTATVSVALPIVAPCEHELDEAVDSEALCGRVVLPDLTPLVADFGQAPTQPVAELSTSIDLVTLPGSVLLRLASATANVGAGPLHMIPAGEPTENGLATWQRIWSDQDRFIDVPTGEFIFHEGHDHFHLNSFEQYRLLTVDGEVVATGDKISFCLIDSLPTMEAPPRRGLGVYPEAACESARDQQVLNVGWADYYGAGLADQWIDVTGIEAGDYLVEIVVDPDDLLIESDETNNRATFPITLRAEDLSSP